LIFLLVGCPAVNKSPEVVKLDGASGKVAADSWTFLWSGSDADGSIIRYEFRKDFADWESNGNETGYTWSEYSEGEHTFEVRALDNEGAYSEIIVWTFNYDPPNVPPAVTKIGGHEGETEESSNAFSWTGNDPDGEIVGFELRKDSGEWVDAELSTEYTWNGYSEGEHTFEVRALDNEGAYSEIIAWTFNYDPPNVPPAVTKTGGLEGETEESSNTFSWTGNDPDGEIVRYEIRKDSGEWIDAELSTEYTWNGYSEGEHTFEVRALDNEGAYSKIIVWTFNYDPPNEPPIVTKTGGVEGETDNASNVFSWSGNDPDGTIVEYEYRKDAGVWTNIGMENEYVWSGYSIGNHSFEVRARDDEGSYSPTLVWNFEYVLHNNAPTVTKTGGIEGDTTRYLNTFTWTGSDSDGSIERYEYRKDRGDWISVGTDLSYTWRGYSEGNHVFEVRALDDGGAYSQIVIWSFTYSYANQPPVITKTGGLEGDIHVSSNSFSWTGSDSDGTIAKYEYSKDNGDWVDFGLGTNYTWSGYSEGSHSFRVRGRDDRGAYSEEALWSFTYSIPPQEMGAFKVVNSWGVGGWENVPDGFLYITYEAMKENQVRCFTIDPREDYEPRAIAVFEISHGIRDDCEITVGVGNPSSPIREKRFDDYSYRGGQHPFPDNKMVLDITELLPFEDETLFLKVFDSFSDFTTGSIEFFSVEVFDSYQSETPVAIYTSTETPKNTVNNSFVNVQIHNVLATQGSSYYLSSIRQGLSTEMLELLKADLGVLEEGRNYNEIIDGHGTGLRPPSEDDWDEIARTWHLMDGFSVQGSLPSTLDHSVSMYFPPVGDQGGEGSCVAFSNGYYTSTFYEARDRGWDLSGADWTDGGEPTPSYQNRIFSPDFIYHQINDGEDGGSSYLDAQKLLSRVGVSSWEKMPYDTSDHTSWPSESAWREAPRYRNGMNVISYLTVRTDQDILTIKSYLAAGYLVSVSIDANQYKNLTEKDVWNTSTYIYPDTNHANTIVGYDDNFNGSP